MKGRQTHIRRFSKLLDTDRLVVKGCQLVNRFSDPVSIAALHGDLSQCSAVGAFKQSVEDFFYEQWGKKRDIVRLVQ
ncbi:hypothetical protein D3C72_2263600 [compost metagenome]